MLAMQLSNLEPETKDKIAHKSYTQVDRVLSPGIWVNHSEITTVALD